ncbi:hypothetical protein [Bosea sp. AAP35]|uniref:hypothetical protein n=1 Tax=Bosea sp. AAP35 TaxID=1523417 RepID=UPI000A49EC04|nr:hypothetical protein [Bosea sp. AAP35]
MDEIIQNPEDHMTVEELMALPSYVPPMEERLAKAKGRSVTYYPAGYAVIEPREPSDDLIIVLRGRR